MGMLWMSMVQAEGGDARQNQPVGCDHEHQHKHTNTHNYTAACLLPKKTKQFHVMIKRTNSKLLQSSTVL